MKCKSSADNTANWRMGPTRWRWSGSNIHIQHAQHNVWIPFGFFPRFFSERMCYWTICFPLYFVPVYAFSASFTEKQMVDNICKHTHFLLLFSVSNVVDVYIPEWTVFVRPTLLLRYHRCNDAMCIGIACELAYSMMSECIFTALFLFNQCKISVLLYIQSLVDFRKCI